MHWFNSIDRFFFRNNLLYLFNWNLFFIFFIFHFKKLWFLFSCFLIFILIFLWIIANWSIINFCEIWYWLSISFYKNLVLNLSLLTLKAFLRVNLINAVKNHFLTNCAFCSLSLWFDDLTQNLNIQAFCFLMLWLNTVEWALNLNAFFF